MATDTPYKISLLKRIVDCHFGSQFLYFCPSYDTGTGWGAPFYSGDPAVEVNPPFGTALVDSAGSHNNRHKIAPIGASATFAEQHDDSGTISMPGNTYWTDNTKTLSWWGVPSAGNVDHPCNGESCPSHSVGDLFTTKVSSSTPRSIYFLSYQKTSGACSGINYYLADIETKFGTLKLSDINNVFWVDGVKYTLPTFHAGNYGRWVSGAGMIGDWIVYNDIEVVNPSGTTFIVPVQEYVTAYNITTSETRLLGSSTAYASSTTVNQPNQPINMNRVYYSQNGLNWITTRNTDQTSGDNFVNWVRGSITLDGSNDPISCSFTIGTDNFTMGGFYYGYKNNVEVAEWNYEPEVDNYIRITHMDADKDFALGYHLQTRIGCWGVTFRDAPTDIILKMGNDIWVYPINQTTGLPSITTKSADYSSWESLVLGLAIDSTETYGSPYSAVMSDVGAYISVGRQGFYDANCYAEQPHHQNKFIALDGTVTDMGEALLNNTVNGELFSVSPMIISNV